MRREREGERKVGRVPEGQHEGAVVAVELSSILTMVMVHAKVHL